MIIYAGGDLKKTRNSCLRADSHGANKSLKMVGILPVQEAALPAGSCRLLAPPLEEEINGQIRQQNSHFPSAK
jgi:hypothetical protein